MPLSSGIHAALSTAAFSCPRIEGPSMLLHYAHTYLVAMQVATHATGMSLLRASTRPIHDNLLEFGEIDTLGVFEVGDEDHLFRLLK